MNEYKLRIIETFANLRKIDRFGEAIWNMEQKFLSQTQKTKKGYPKC